MPVTRAEELDALAERVEKLTGPDREVDALVWLAVTPGATREQRMVKSSQGLWPDYEIDETRDATNRLIIVPSYTSSLDAAMSLVPEGLEWHVSNSTTRRLPNNTPEHFHGWAGVYGGPIIGSECDSFGFIPALALTCAALRAHASIIREAGR